MSLEVPMLVFPTPGPVLPPSPESTIEPLPSADDPRLQNAYPGLLDMSWYLYSALQNEETYPHTNEFPPYYNSMHMGDVLEPIASTPVDDPQSQSEWVLGWDMWCLLCDSGTGDEEMERNFLTQYPFCGEGMLSMEPLVSSAEEREWNGERKWELRVPNETSYTDADSIMACAVELILNPEKIQVPRQISQPFMVSRLFRADESQYPEIRMRYTEAFPYGVYESEFSEEEQLFSSAMSSSSSSAYYYPTSSRYWGYGPYSSSTQVSMATSGSSPDDSDDYDPALNSSAQAAMGVCITIIGVAAVCLVLMCNRKARKRMVVDPRTADRLPTHEDRQQGATAEWQSVGRRSPGPATGTHGRSESIELRQPAPETEPGALVRASAAVEEGSDEVPPLYHEVVTNRERMFIEQRMHREGSAPSELPPTYLDAQHVAAPGSRATASSTSIPRPRTAMTTPPRRSAPYPTLPSSPPS
ncbi:hypothetical protein DDE82_004732 [Stemphylium lycopersici]|uniref:Uncharacterized protein n=1 Tax=Stemphylium lycopersici TaxID=183478 RepID=A0A364MUF2_STELY|nr:hypothetical protein TW65_05478 [Stemphylium lycopersici]RAR04008.1 hypothetical protein DDE83_008019 [Stemphylium lycopersici]RAR04078.1 hypothetical protein DDE82_004732 [Stemphylium lycopersici]